MLPNCQQFGLAQRWKTEGRSKPIRKVSFPFLVKHAFCYKGKEPWIFFYVVVSWGTVFCGTKLFDTGNQIFQSHASQTASCTTALLRQTHWGNSLSQSPHQVYDLSREKRFWTPGMKGQVSMFTLSELTPAGRFLMENIYGKKATSAKSNGSKLLSIDRLPTSFLNRNTIWLSKNNILTLKRWTTVTLDICIAFVTIIELIWW